MRYTHKLRKLHGGEHHAIWDEQEQCWVGNASRDWVSTQNKVDVLNDPEPQNGYKRQWLVCNICGKKQYYDYIPYVLSSPVMISICGHDINRDMERIK